MSCRQYYGSVQGQDFDAQGDSAHARASSGLRLPRVLYLGMAYDYGRPERGPSYEQMNFLSSLQHAGYETHQFDFMERQRIVGTSAMRKELVRMAGELDVDVVFSVLFTNELDGATLRAVRESTGAPLINWFADDHWRLSEFSIPIAASLDWIVTTFPDAVPEYEARGLGNVILSQWACNQHLYRPMSDAASDSCVSFVGSAYGDRPSIVRSIADSGVDVACWGSGWKSGRLDFDQMIQVFSRSAVNLNLAGSYRPSFARSLVLHALRKGGDRKARPPQIKGRVFELAGCAAFQITESVPHLADYFDLGTEMVAYSDRADLIEKVHYWLDHAAERRLAAEAAHKRVLRDHTWERRFADIFNHAGVS